MIVSKTLKKIRVRLLSCVYYQIYIYHMRKKNKFCKRTYLLPKHAKARSRMHSVSDFSTPLASYNVYITYIYIILSYNVQYQLVQDCVHTNVILMRFQTNIRFSVPTSPTVPSRQGSLGQRKRIWKCPPRG